MQRPIRPCESHGPVGDSSRIARDGETTHQAIPSTHQASEIRAPGSEIASAEWALIVASSSHPPLRLHLAVRHSQNRFRKTLALNWDLGRYRIDLLKIIDR